MNKEILRLAIPNIISNITVPLLGLVDTYVAAHLEKTEYIGAISLSSTLFMVMYMAFSFLRMGTSGFTAQAYGSKNVQLQADIFLRAVTVGLVAGLFLIALQHIIALFGFGVMMNGDPLTKQYAKQYFSIYIWAAPAILMQYCFNGWFVGMQNSTYPMITAILINVLNILFTLLFVWGLGMQIEGVAYATALAQMAGLVISICLWHYKYKDIRKFFCFDILKKLSGYTRFFLVNTDIFLRTMLLASVTFFFTSTSSKYGEYVLPCNAILMQFFYLYSYIMDGFAYAAEALTGKYIGAKNNVRLRKLFRSLFLWGGIFVVLFTFIYLFWNEDIVKFLTDKEVLMPYLMKYKDWTLLIPFAGCAAFLWDGIFIGAMASKQMRNSMLLAAILFFVIYYFLSTFVQNDNNTLWISFIVFLLARGVIQTCLSKKILLSIR